MIGFITKVSSFGALARYLQAGTGGPTERRVLWTKARYVSGDLQKAAAEMNLTGHLAETETLGYHLTIGLDPGDRPTRAEMEYAVERTLSALGLADNMAITVAHGDAYFAHTHTMVARWDYWTARVVEASNSYYVITRVMRELEEELGMEPAPRPHWERAGRKREGGRDRSENVRKYLAERFPIAARNRARSALQSATSWGHLQALLREEGLRFQRGRDNLLIAKGEVSVRAGQITGGTSLAKLEARFGQTLREHEAGVCERLIEPVGEAPPEEKARARLQTGDHTRTDRDTTTGRGTEGRGPGTGRKRAREEKQAEGVLLALAKALGRREEAYQLTRRSALLEAEEADAAGLQQDLQLLETRGTALLEDLLRAGVPFSRQGSFRSSELEEARRLRDQARELWRSTAWEVERRTAQGVTPQCMGGALAKALTSTGTGREGRVGDGPISKWPAGRSSPDETERLLALLSEHRQAAGQAARLFGLKAANACKRGGGDPWRLSETETPNMESSMGADSYSAESPSEEVLPGGQSQQNGAEMLVDSSAANPSAEALLKETREAIREARADIEKRLRGLQLQVRGGDGAAALERKLRQVLGRLADRDLEAASRFARRYVMEPGGKGGVESELALERESLEGETLHSPAVQEALRRALPEGVQLERKRGVERKSASRSR